MTEGAFSSEQRRQLFLEMAASAIGGVSVAEVYQRATEEGDTATEEAYYNLARRLVHRAMLVANTSHTPTRYQVGSPTNDQWLQEHELAEAVDPDYPLIGLTVWQEAVRQVADIPETIWIELRERLAVTPARPAFVAAITSYLDDLHAEISELASATDHDSVEFQRGRKKAEANRRFLWSFLKYGLGLSDDAVALPPSIDLALRSVSATTTYVNATLLREEIDRRVEDSNMIVDIPRRPSSPNLIVAGVDGSTRGGLLTVAVGTSDFHVAHAPLVNINTAVGQINRSVRTGGREHAVFLRLPERPEDMQRQDNRFTVMAKLLYPDLTDAEYMHAVWNAMELSELKATLRVLRRWETGRAHLEVPPADVVLRDGTMTPQERDFSHYMQLDSYGRITRDIFETSWEIALRAREEDRPVSGVVKASQVTIIAPVINWLACNISLNPKSQIQSWPLETMNVVPDQALVTRLLTAGRTKRDTWTRTCLVSRPFHAVTRLTYSRSEHPADVIIQRHEREVARAGESGLQHPFWSTFQGERDSYVRMLRNVNYASFYIAVVPRLDHSNMLPRFEMLVTAPTVEDPPRPIEYWSAAMSHLDRIIDALFTVGWDVGAEHNMFQTDPKLDVQPSILIKAHETVKIWANDLLSRVQEFIGFHLAAYTKSKRMQGIQVRPFTKGEMTALLAQLKRERELQAGAQPDPPQLGGALDADV